MKTISATEFKAKCLHLMDEVQKTGECITVTKHGKPVATLGPAPSEAPIDWTPGKFRDSVKIVGDICVDGKDLGIEWEAMK